MNQKSWADLVAKTKDNITKYWLYEQPHTLTAYQLFRLMNQPEWLLYYAQDFGLLEEAKKYLETYIPQAIQKLRVISPGLVQELAPRSTEQLYEYCIKGHSDPHINYVLWSIALTVKDFINPDYPGLKKSGPFNQSSLSLLDQLTLTIEGFVSLATYPARQAQEAAKTEEEKEDAAILIAYYKKHTQADIMLAFDPLIERILLML